MNDDWTAFMLDLGRGMVIGTLLALIILHPLWLT